MNGYFVLAIKDTRNGQYKFLTVRKRKLSFSKDKPGDSNNCLNYLFKYTENENKDNTNKLIHNVTNKAVFCKEDTKRFKRLCGARDAREIKFV